MTTAQTSRLDRFVVALATRVRRARIMALLLRAAWRVVEHDDVAGAAEDLHRALTLDLKYTCEVIGWRDRRGT